MGQKAITIDEQIELLRSRGMVIRDVEKAKEVLFDIGYFRLGFYWFPFEQTYPEKHNRTHQFKDSTNFDDAVKLYYFDFKLRSVLLKTISRIEVAFRTKIIYLVSNKNPNKPTGLLILWLLHQNKLRTSRVKFTIIWFRITRYLQDIIAIISMIFMLQLGRLWNL